MQFLGGYGRHPPLTGWIARLWYSVFPAANWSSYALSEVMTGVSLGSIYLIGRHALGRRRATLVVFAMMLYPLYFGAKADRFNNYQVLLAVMPLTVWLFLRAFDKPTAPCGPGARGGRGGRDAHDLFRRFRLDRDRACRIAASRPPAILHKSRALCGRDCLSASAFAAHSLARPQRFFVAALGDRLRRRSLPPRARRDLSRPAFRASRLLSARPGDRAMAVAVAVRSHRCAAAKRTVARFDHCRCAGRRPGFGRTRIQCLSQTRLGQSVFLLGADRGGRPCCPGAGHAPSRSPERWWSPQFSPSACWSARRFIPGSGSRRSRTTGSTGRSRKPPPRLRSSGTTGFIRGCRSSCPALRLPRRSSSTVPIIRKCTADFDPAYSPWIDYPAELKRKGYVGVCFADDAACRAALKALNPNAEQVDIAVQRQRYGIATPPMKLHLEFTGPNP